MIRKIFLYMMTGSLWLMTLGCGSSGPTPATVTTSLSLPPSLSSLSDYQTSLRLYDSENRSVLGSVLLKKVTSRSWSAEISEIPVGDYVAQIDMTANATSAGGLANFNSQLSLLRQPLLIAIARRSFSFPGGLVATTLAFQPSDFFVEFDEDQDGRLNLSEYLNGLDPFSNDTDQDGVLDGQDLFPLDIQESIDEDHDGIGNVHDNCVSIANPLQENFDQDRFGDLCDDDRDNDGLSDVDEARLGSQPFQTDTDQDGLMDGVDNCPIVSNADQVDSDHDHVGDVCDTDDDNDGVGDTIDNCPFVSNEDQADSNQDHRGDACSQDDDGDEVLDTEDNCRTISNRDQNDFDRDGVGDVCDNDDDNDGLLDADENGLGSDHMRTNPLSNDTDADGIVDGRDNCPTLSNSSQTDSDHDGDGDVCDCAPYNANVGIRKGIFISRLRGDDQNSGAQNHPVRTWARALQVAATLENPTLYVSEGLFDEAISLPEGVSVLGGFSDTEICHYDPQIYKTQFTNHESITLSVRVGSVNTTISNIVIQNQGLEDTHIVMQVYGNHGAGTLSLNRVSLLGFTGLPISSLSEALVVTGAKVDAVNNIMVAGEGHTTTGVEWQGSLGRFFHNTIHGGKAQQTSISFKIRHSADSTSLSLINNALVTEHLGGFTSSTLPIFDDQCVIYYEGDGLPVGFEAKGNLLKPLRLPESTETPRLYGDILSQQIFSIDSFNTLDERLETVLDGSLVSNITTNQSLNELFANPSTQDFHPILGSSLIDAGVDPTTEGWEIRIDNDGLARPQGEHYDVGAYELD